MSGIRKALEIGRVNLLRQLRDRSDVFFVIVLPTLIIVALGLQFGGTTNARLGIVYDPADADAAALVAAIEASASLRVAEPDELSPIHVRVDDAGFAVADAA
ncbi:MAG TPA: hypothetical protein VGM28_05605, partial [Candidatus Limnocylindrales bacterium]